MLVNINYWLKQLKKKQLVMKINEKILFSLYIVFVNLNN